MTEEWRDIPGFEGSYQASSLGRIRSLDRDGAGTERRYRLRGRLMSIRKVEEAKHTPTVTLTKAEGREIRTASWWVYAAFFGRPGQGMCTVHRDGDRNNHRPDNLELMPLKKVGAIYGPRSKGRA